MTMFIVILLLALVIVLVIVWSCKTSHRRREERELVLRTKHDIFEGVPNLGLCGDTNTTGGAPVHNVLNSSPTVERSIELKPSEGNTELNLSDVSKSLDEPVIGSGSHLISPLSS